MNKSKLIKNVYTEPIVHAVITELKPFCWTGYRGENWKTIEIYLVNLVINNESIQIMRVTESIFDVYDLHIVLDATDTISLKLFDTEIKRCDLHLDVRSPYYQITNKELERICNASSIQFLGYQGEERAVDFISSPPFFRAYYSVIVDEKKYAKPFSGLSPYYNGFWRRLVGDVWDYSIKTR